MARFVDIPLDVGDANRAITQLTEAVAESSQQQERKEPVRQETRTSEVDPRFAGKSTEEIVAMYKNLESHSGRLSSQLGESRNALNQLILGKRDSDLQTTRREPSKIESTDLLTNPTDTLNRYLEEREHPKVSALQERLAQLEAQLNQTAFQMRHKDAAEVTADPAFAEWVKQTPLRMRLASAAANNDTVSADLLLQEWETHSKAGTASTSNARNRAQEAANRIATENGNIGSESGNSPSTKSGKTYKSTDLIALRQTNPDKYESPAFQREIVQAYREGRVLRDQ